MSVEQVGSEAHLRVRNIGGIEESTVAFEPGVTALVGRNATNRTSLLRAVAAACGSDDVSVKGDAEEGSVELTLDGDTYSRTLESRDGRIHSSGEPYLEDATVASLFAFLLESNDARRAIVTGGDLRELIMRPVDTDEIEAKIDELVAERRRVEDELDELEELKGRLPSLEEERTRLEGEIEDTREELAAVEAEIEQADADVEQSQAAQAELEETLAALREKRATLEDVRYDLETERDSLESLRAEKRAVEADHDALPDAPSADVDDMDARIDRLRSEKQSLESELKHLQSVISFNQDRLDADEQDILEPSTDEPDTDEPVTDELLPDSTVTCWTCGSDVETEQIEATLETLRERSQETVGEIKDLESALETATAERATRIEQQQERDRLERRREALADEIEATETQIESLSERRETLREEIEAMEGAVESTGEDAYEDILDLHREANQLEYDLGTLETELDRVTENIATIEDRLDEESDLEARRAELSEEIEELRTKIERLESEAIEAFNDHMEAILERLEYENLARIWLERTETTVRDGRQRTTKGVFDLHIVRQTDSGATYEDRVANLSESEREVTGLVFALAGYLAHDVHESTPFMLLDSLEAIDSARIAALVSYLEGYAEYLVVALLPEDARALEDSEIDAAMVEF